MHKLPRSRRVVGPIDERMKRKEPPTKTFKGNPKRQKTTPNLLVQKNTVGTGSEIKNFDNVQVLATAVGAATWTLTAGNLLNQVPQGSTEVTHVGRKYTLKKLTVRWTAFLSTTTVFGANVRIKVFYDKQANGNIPAVLDVMAQDSFFSHNNLANADRFITIADIITPPMSTSGDFTCSGNFTKKLSLDVITSGATGTVASIATGSVYLMICQSGEATAAALGVNYTSRLRFEDK